MKESPCDSRCPTYPICQHRDAIKKYEICPRFRLAVMYVIEESQKDVDEEKGKGIMTVVGIRVDGIGPMIDKKGNRISD